VAQGLIGGEAFGPVEGLHQAGEHFRRERDRFAGGDVGIQQSVKTPGGVTCQPASDRIAVDAQQAGHLLTLVGLPTRQQVEHLQAKLFVAVMFTLQPVLEIIRMVRDTRYGCTHRLSSRFGSLPRSRRIATICIIFNSNVY
jgi:hypothetical protein